MKNIKEVVEKNYGKNPEKIVQFGEGNFLRAFVDWMVEDANERGNYAGSIVLCQPIEGNEIMKQLVEKQEGNYTVVMRGIEDGKPVERTKVITSVSRCINAYDDYEALMALARSKDLEVVVSNTTESGIVYKEGNQFSDKPAQAFPAKVTRFLYERFQAFQGDITKGLLFLPVELIDQNGTVLKNIVLQYAREWNLEAEFIQWIHEANKFTNTLVDRIVTGYPKDQVEEFKEKLGYEDALLVACEVFNLWVIEGEKEWADILPVHKGSANVLWTADAKPYKMRKVRILNGGHTATVLAAYLAGHNIVLDFMQDELFKKYLEQVLYGEVIPTLALPKKELETFAKAVGERFANPYIKHSLLDISLNSFSKFTARCLPSLLGYVDENKALPPLLTFSLAAMIAFYQIEQDGDSFVGMRADGTKYQVKDDQEVLLFMEQIWQINEPQKVVSGVLKQQSFWGGKDLTKVQGLMEQVTADLEGIQTIGIQAYIKTIFCKEI